MNTAQPALTRLYADILSLVLEKRLRNAFRAAGLPFASLDFHYEDSAMTPGDEHLTLQVNTSTYDMEAAATLLGRTLYALDSLGVLPAEYQDARSRIAAEERRASVVREDRQASTDRCIRAFLYGETLASATDIYASVLGRSLGAKQELDFFNRYVSALLDPVRNLSFTVLQPRTEVDPQPAFDAFRKGWATDGEPIPVRYRTSSADSLRLGKGARKLKLRAQPVSDPVTGGEFWTFPNGIRVLYKQNKRFEGQFDYMMLLYGGVEGVSQLQAGESPYVGDMLLLSRIAGRSGEDFQDMLAANAWNVAQYAALLMMIAQLSGLEAGELVHVIADAHIYDRHIPIVEELITRESYPAPKVTLDPTIDDFYAFTPESFTVENYIHGEKIPKFPVAV